MTEKLDHTDLAKSTWMESHRRQRNANNYEPEICPDNDEGHHWIIPPPSDKVMPLGKCKHCGAERMHQNWS